MKKLLLILAVISAALCAKAQNGVMYDIDTLTFEKLYYDYATLNQQVDAFRRIETKSLHYRYAGEALALATAYVGIKHPQMENLAVGLGIGSLVCFVASAVCEYQGYTMLKRDRFMLTPDGVVIKLKYRD